MRAIGPVHKKVAKGGEKYIGLARTLLGQLAMQIKLSNGILTQRAMNKVLPDGTRISVGIVGGQRYLNISHTKVGGEKLIPPAGFRFTPWENNTLPGIISRNNRGVWDVKIIDLKGGTNANGASTKQYISFYYVDCIGDTALASRFIDRFSSRAYKDGYQIFALYDYYDGSYVIGATIIEDFMLVFAFDYESLFTYQAPLVEVVTEETIVEWELISTDTFGASDFDVVTPVVFKVGSSTGYFTFIDYPDYPLPSITSVATIDITVTNGVVNVNVDTEGYPAEATRVRTYTPEGEQKIEDNHETSRSSYMMGTGNAHLKEGYIYSGCLSVSAMGAWIDNRLAAYDFSTIYSTEQDCEGNIFTRSGGGWNVDENGTEIPGENENCHSQCYGFSVRSMSGDTININAVSKTTDNIITKKPLLSFAGLGENGLELGFYTETRTYRRQGYYTAGFPETNIIGGCPLISNVPGPYYPVWAATYTAYKHYTYYHGGKNYYNYQTKHTGHLGDYVLYSEINNTTCDKKAPNAYSTPIPDDTPDDGDCGFVDPTAPSVYCTSASQGTCGNYLNIASGEKNLSGKDRYIASYRDNVYLDLFWNSSYTVVQSPGYDRGYGISTESTDCSITYTMVLVIDGTSVSLDGFEDKIINESDRPSLTAGNVSGYNDSDDHYFSPWIVYSKWYSFIRDIHGNLLFSIYAARPYPAADWGDDIEGNAFHAHRFVYDKEQKKFIDIAPLYNTAIDLYNETHETSYSYMGSSIIAIDYETTPLKSMGII